MSTAQHILVVDDEADLVELVSYNLRKEGFTVDTALDGETALKKVRKNHYDLLSLDLMLPGIQGIDICRILRNDPNTANLPIIILTAKDDEVSRVLGLEIGADDYIVKPFSTTEFIARVKAVLRRSQGKPLPEKLLKIQEIEIDLDRYTVNVRGKYIKLSATEFKLLVFLAERKGKVFARHQLLDAIWQDDSLSESRTVDVHIRRLRSLIERDPSNPRYLKTFRGIGYFFEAK
jgi:DNA-binding response OmpR family regulator